ncbi:Nuclear receptor corepressor 2, partial [Ophiophagus hannah]
MGLEAIIRKALMGKYDHRWDEPAPLSANAFNPLNASPSLPAVLPVTSAEGQIEEMHSSMPGSTPFPYNPLTVRLSTGVVTGPPPPTATVLQGNSGTQNHGWEEEPKPLLVSQYETLSDSE